jgi:hypothetical protein
MGGESTTSALEHDARTRLDRVAEILARGALRALAAEAEGAPGPPPEAEKDALPSSRTGALMSETTGA